MIPEDTDDVRSRVRTGLLESRLYYGWFVVFGCFLLATMTSGTIYSFSVFLAPVVETFDQSYANTSLVFSVQSLVTFGGAALLGFAVDRYGIRPLLVVAAVLLVVGLVGASQSPSFVGVVVGYSVVAAVGLGIVFVVAFTTPPRWFERRRGLATGVAVSGWGVGILVMPPFVEFVIDAIGWQLAYLVLAALFLAAIAVAVPLVANRPRALGVDVAGEFANPGAEHGAESDPRTLRTHLEAVVATARTRLFALVFVGVLLGFAPWYAVVVYFVEFAESVGATRRIGVYAISLVGVLNVAAKFTAGGLADRVGNDRVLAGCVSLMCAATVGLVFVPTPANILVLAAVFGFGGGGVAALMTPLLADLFGTDDLSTLFGITSIGIGIGGVFVPFLTGAAFDRFAAYDVPFLATAAVGAIAIVAFLTIRAVRPESTVST